MKTVVKKLDEQQAIIDFHIQTGVITLVIKSTDYGYKHEDYSEWDITDEEYYKIEDIVDKIADKMNGDDEVVNELD